MAVPLFLLLSWQMSRHLPEWMDLIQWGASSANISRYELNNIRVIFQNRVVNNYKWIDRQIDQSDLRKDVIIIFSKLNSCSLFRDLPSRPSIGPAGRINYHIPHFMASLVYSDISKLRERVFSFREKPLLHQSHQKDIQRFSWSISKQTSSTHLKPDASNSGSTSNPRNTPTRLRVGKPPRPKQIAKKLLNYLNFISHSSKPLKMMPMCLANVSVEAVSASRVKKFRRNVFSQSCGHRVHPNIQDYYPSLSISKTSLHTQATQPRQSRTNISNPPNTRPSTCKKPYLKTSAKQFLCLTPWGSNDEIKYN